MRGPSQRFLGRRIFGRDAARYDRARLRYPPRVYAILEQRCGLGPGCRTFEVGPGTGIATRELLRRGARPLTVVEPDRRMADFLAHSMGPRARSVTILRVPFERVRLPGDSFDLGVAATSFHWVAQRPAIRTIAQSLRPGGWWAQWTTFHAQPRRSNRFVARLQETYRRSGQPTWTAKRRAADVDRRVQSELRQLRAARAFEQISAVRIAWSVELDTRRIVDLWSTFSDIARLPTPVRRRFLRELGTLVDTEFGGRVRLPILTTLLTARRRASKGGAGRRASAVGRRRTAGGGGGRRDEVPLGETVGVGRRGRAVERRATGGAP